MTGTDATLATLEKFNDPTQWDHVDYDVPVFREHELWEVPHPLDKERTVRIAVLPGYPKPKEGRLLYSIGAEELGEIAERINRNLEENGKAVKGFLGHSGSGKSQKEEPDVVAYGVGAHVGPFGPKSRLAVLIDRLMYVPGSYSEAKKYPERSSEFNPITGDLTGVALLKTEPKLPMGMVTYAQEGGLVRYGSDVMADEREDDDREEGEEETPKDKPDTEEEASEEAEDKPAVEDPTTEPDADDLTEDERAFADRMMKYYQRTVPAVQYACRMYAESQKPAEAPLPAAPGDMPTDANNPSPDDPEAGQTDKGKPAAGDEENEEKPDMAKEAADKINYQQLEATVKGLSAKVNALEKSNGEQAEKYALAESKRLLSELVHEGYRFKDAKKELAKLAKLTDEGRAERVAEIRENYACEGAAPVGDMIDILGDNVEEGPAKVSLDQIEPDAVVLYCEENKLDVAKDWDKAVEAIYGKKKAA